MAVVLQAITFNDGEDDNHRFYVIVKSLSNILGMFQQLSMCYVAYNLTLCTKRTLVGDQDSQLIDSSETDIEI